MNLYFAVTATDLITQLFVSITIYNVVNNIFYYNTVKKINN